MERKKLAPGVFITTLDAKKFNRCRITIHLRYPALRRSATDAAVLPLVLERGYAGCPDMTELSRKLARLYGADLGVPACCPEISDSRYERRFSQGLRCSAACLASA